MLLTDHRKDRRRIASDFVASPAGDFFQKGSETFKPGDLLTRDSNGLANASVAAGSNFTSAGEPILGFAMDDATGTASDPIDIQRVNKGTRMTLPVYHSTPGSAVNSIAKIGVSCQLRNDGTYGLMVDVENTSNPVVKIVGIPTNVDGIDVVIGEQYGFVEVIFLDAAVVN